MYSLSLGSVSETLKLNDLTDVPYIYLQKKMILKLNNKIKNEKLKSYGKKSDTTKKIFILIPDPSLK